MAQAQAADVIEVKTDSVKCDGGGALGHPLIYLEFGEQNRLVCPYCSRTFVKK